MKSIIQEGSSVFKALEKAWLSAGSPKEFSVKVFEEPQKNFIGMTVKSAKIGIFFDEKAMAPQAYKKQPESRPQQREAPRESLKKQSEIIARQPRKPLQEEPKKHIKTEEKPAVQQASSTQKRTVWADDMIANARIWIASALEAMDKKDISFSTQANNYYLRITFEKPLLGDEEKERQLFRSFSFLLLQALKRKFKRPLRGFKIVLTR
ncbi:MAG: hypothetical protein AB7R69_05675 [Candidatus Babeliales bacterium]